MPKRYFNWKLAVVLLIGLVVLSVTAYGLRQWQRSTRAEEGRVLGMKAYEQQNWEEAAQQLGRYVALANTDIDAVLKYAEANLNIRPMKRGPIQQAIAAYRTVLRQDPDNTEAVEKLGQIYMNMMRQAGEAELIAKNYLERRENPSIRRLHAAARAAQRDFAGAATELKRLIEKDPNDVAAYEMLGKLLEARPDELEGTAEQWYTKALENNPSSALARIALADYHLRHQNRSKGLELLLEAEQQEILETSSRLRLAESLINAGEVDKAESHLEQVRSVDSDNQSMWSIWSQVAIASGSTQKMRKIADEGLKALSKQPWDFLPRAAELLIRAGEIDRARQCVSKMEEKEMLPAHVAFLKGLMASQDGNKREAAKHWTNAIELGYDAPVVRLALSAALSADGDTLGAVQQLRTLTVQHPRNAQGHLSLARLLFETKDWAQALEHARQASQLAPDNLEAAQLEIQAMMQLSEQRDSAWTDQDIERRLTQLQEKGGADTLTVKLLSLNLALKEGDFTDAKGLIADMRDTYPDDPRVPLAEARVLMEQDPNDSEGRAKLVLNKAIERFGDNAELPAMLAAIAANEPGGKAQCEAILNSAIERISDARARRNLSIILANYYQRWEEEDKAVQVLEEVVKSQPNDITAKRALLKCDSIAEDPERSQQLVDQIKEIEGEDGWRWRYEQARLWHIQGDQTFQQRQEEIIALLKENLQNNADDRDSKLLLADTYRRAGQTDAALAIYREMLNGSPNDPRIIKVTVNALQNAGLWDEANRILDEAEANDLQDPTIQRLRVRGYLQRGELGRASVLLQEFITLDPNDTSSEFTLAVLKMREKKWDEAEAILERLRTRFPESLQVAATQIQLKIRRDQPQEAIRLSNDIVEDHNNIEAYVLRATTYSSLRDYEKAEEDFSRAVALEPDNFQTWLTRSNFYASIGEREKAVEDILKALELAPENARVQQLAVSMLMATGDPARIAQAEKIISQSLDRDPNSINLQFMQARTLMDSNDPNELMQVENMLTAITKKQPKAVNAWIMLGQLMEQRARGYEAILDVARQGLIHNPDNRSLLLLKAAAQRQESPLLAISTYRQLRDKDPNDLGVALLLADALIAAQQPQQAEELARSYRDALGEDGPHSAFTERLARALYKQGRAEEAYRELNAEIEADPNNPGPIRTKIDLLCDQELWQEAVQTVRHWQQQHPDDVRTLVATAGALSVVKDEPAHPIARDLILDALEAAPNSVLVLRALGSIYQVLGQFDQAVEQYKRVLEVAPNDRVTMNNLAWILCEEEKRYQDALEYARRALELAPGYTDARDTLGVIYHRLDRFEDAEREFRQALREYRKDGAAGQVAYTHFHLARTLDKSGNVAEAIRHVHAALERQDGGDTSYLDDDEKKEAEGLLERLQQPEEGGK